MGTVTPDDLETFIESWFESNCVDTIRSELQVEWQKEIQASTAKEIRKWWDDNGTKSVGKAVDQLWDSSVKAKLSSEVAATMPRNSGGGSANCNCETVEKQLKAEIQ